MNVATFQSLQDLHGKAAQRNHKAWWLYFSCELRWPKWVTLVWRRSPHLYFMMAERSNFIECYMIHNHGEALRPPFQLLFILDEKMAINVLTGLLKDYIHPQTLSWCDIRWWNRWCLLLSPMKLWIFLFRDSEAPMCHDQNFQPIMIIDSSSTFTGGQLKPILPSGSRFVRILCLL